LRRLSRDWRRGECLRFDLGNISPKAATKLNAVVLQIEQGIDLYVIFTPAGNSQAHPTPSKESQKLFAVETGVVAVPQSSVGLCRRLIQERSEASISGCSDQGVVR